MFNSPHPRSFSRPPMKLWEGNVFTGVCLSRMTDGGGDWVPGPFLVPGLMSFQGGYGVSGPMSLL